MYQVSSSYLPRGDEVEVIACTNRGCLDNSEIRDIAVNTTWGLLLQFI